MVGDKLWNAMACPGILYGCEIIQMDEDTYEKLEIAQNAMARSILGARKFCSVIALRNELGWKSMRARIYEAKLKFWGKIYYQKNSRWARLTYQSSVYEGWNSKWYNEIMKIRRTLGLDTMANVDSQKQWNNMITEAIKKFEMKTFQKAKENQKTLMWYNSPFNEKRKILPYINGSKESAAFFNTKSGSWVLKYEGKQLKKCKLCGERDNEIHRILRCEKVQSIRNSNGLEDLISEIRSDAKSDIEIMGSLTIGPKEECLERRKMFLEIEEHIKQS